MRWTFFCRGCCCYSFWLDSKRVTGGRITFSLYTLFSLQLSFPSRQYSRAPLYFLHATLHSSFGGVPSYVPCCTEWWCSLTRAHSVKGVWAERVTCGEKSGHKDILCIVLVSFSSCYSTPACIVSWWYPFFFRYSLSIETHGRTEEEISSWVYGGEEEEERSFSLLFATNRLLCFDRQRRRTFYIVYSYSSPPLHHPHNNNIPCKLCLNCLRQAWVKGVGINERINAKKDPNYLGGVSTTTISTTTLSSNNNTC